MPGKEKRQLPLLSRQFLLVPAADREQDIFLASWFSRGSEDAEFLLL
jgi:hypothetical protein